MNSFGDCLVQIEQWLKFYLTELYIVDALLKFSTNKAKFADHEACSYFCDKAEMLQGQTIGEQKICLIISSWYSTVVANLSLKKSNAALSGTNKIPLT